MSTQFKKQFGEVWINFPGRIDYESLKEIRIHPKYNARYFETVWADLHRTGRILHIQG